MALGDIYLRLASQARQLCHIPPFSHTTLSHTIFLTLSQSRNFVTHHLSHTISLTRLCNKPSFTHHRSHTTLSHTIFDTPSLTHHLCHTTSFTHHLCHTPSCTHTIFHTPLCHTSSLTHHLSHTTLSPTIFHTQLCHTLSVTHHLSHTPSFPHTHNFVTHTHTHHLSLSHTIFHIQRCHTHTHTTSFYFSILHNLNCLSFPPRPRYNIWCSLLEEVALWANCAAAICQLQGAKSGTAVMTFHQYDKPKAPCDGWYSEWQCKT